MAKKFIQLSCNKVLLQLVVILFISTLAFAQKNKIGSAGYLQTAIGFKDIKLGEDINKLNYARSYLDDDSRFDADSCLKLAVSDSSALKFTNDLNLSMIGVRTYKNKIVNIYLFFPKKDGSKMLSTFIATYGGYFTKPDEDTNIYTWDSKKVSLSLMYQADVEYGVAIFTYKSLAEYIVEVKELAAMKNRAQNNKAPKPTAILKNALASNNTNN
ncbi:hypothetical protein [Mucilaginibacter boryungensis]|uniref:DUF4468 domain-containing protein n=1 Tax=Mucilaginibacter boryungensis TaxID=768480 RepID=A0ABR9XIH4_9SPHI|nr:hypothetical protein [Mucilaginibacter boryungensis]MBE9666829.1 hypothetical protein [Mucilaginibacter boryungensis]